MKHRLSGILAACVLVVFSSAGEPTVPAKPLGVTERQLLALTQEWVDAEVSRDGAVLRRVLDDRFLATFGAGQLIKKEDYIQAVVSPEAKRMLSQTLTDETFLVEENVAVLVGSVAIRRMTENEPETRNYRYTATYLKRDGRWVVLALHMVRVPPPK